MLSRDVHVDAAARSWLLLDKVYNRRSHAYRDNIQDKQAPIPRRQCQIPIRKLPSPDFQAIPTCVWSCLAHFILVPAVRSQIHIISVTQSRACAQLTET